MRTKILALLLCSAIIQVPSAVAKVEHTNDFSETVVRITTLKFTPSLKLGLTGNLNPSLGVDAKFGTGFCLDAACRFIATNYHVAATTLAGKVEREKIVQRYFATGPHVMRALPRTSFRTWAWSHMLRSGTLPSWSCGARCPIVMA